MMQGDHYNLGIKIQNNAGSPVTDKDVLDVEITIGHMRKTFGNGELSYADGMWFFPVSQEESFEMVPGAVNAQVRVHWNSGVVEGKPMYGVRGVESISKEVL